MNIEKMRSEFEAAAEQHFMLKERYLYWNDGEEEYEDPDVQLAYEFFLLSRETLVIELPQRLSYEMQGITVDPKGDLIEYCDTVAAIQSTGVKVK